MIKAIYKIGSVAASGAIVLSAFAPVASAATQITISGNGAFSNNTANVAQTNTTTLTQSNNADINNHVTSNASSGGNSAFGNTGGNVGIQTGSASTDTNVTNNVNANAATVANCGTCTGNTTVKIAGNGVASDNEVNLAKTNTTTVSQTNDAHIGNDVDSKANSGGNNADFNTGGSVLIGTGAAHAGADVVTRANSNVAQIGAGTGNGGGVDLEVLGNGAFSDNTINAALTNATVLGQANNADIYNDVDVNANSGYNKAFGNTGGNVLVGTGSASTHVGVLNDVNRNWASVAACGCADDVTVKIAENGAAGGFGEYFYFGSGSNEVNLALDNAQAIGQGNDADLDNITDGKANSGENDVTFSTGPVHGDPAVLTGHTDSDTTVVNTGNTNTFGATTLPSPMPTGGSLSSFWAMWALWMSNMSM